MAVKSAAPNSFSIKVDADKATAEFKEARKEIKRRLKEGLQRGAERVAVPAARAIAPMHSGKLKAAITAKATQGGSAYLTIKGGKKMAYGGVLEFGGTVRGFIRPRKGKAVLVNGRPVALVKAPRKYAERAFIRGAISARSEAIAEAVGEEVFKAFDGFEEGGEQ